MSDDVEIEDGSNDRKYFSLLPHYILNHSTAVDQALYMQMKRYSGETKNGTCWASKRTLMEKLGVGRKALDKSLAYLIQRGWIEFKEKKKIATRGGEQEVSVYAVKDIWKMNVDYYKGASESTHLGASESTPPPKGASESTSKVRLKVRKGASERAPNKNHINKNHIKQDTAAAGAAKKIKEKKFTSEGAEVIKLLEAVDPKNKTYYNRPPQREAADFIVSEYGIESATKVIALLPKYNSLKFAKKTYTAVQLRDNWCAIRDYLISLKQDQIAKKSMVV